MEIKQETKSLPRNRKCGNCRYFEPAPLWRKGWCRNPRLYDRRANHLVDASTIDCEQVFRARIYWEPVPTSENVEATTGYSPFVATTGDEGGFADSGRNRPVNDGVLRSRTGGTQITQPEAGLNLPVITRREKAAAAPGIVARPNQVRSWLNENIPYYDKIDGPISRINLLKVLPWMIIIILALVVLINVTGGKKEATTDSNTQNSTTLTSPAATTGSLNSAQTAAVISNNPNNPNRTNATATPTLSTLVPTATAVPPTSATTRAVETKAKVKGTQSTGLNVRKEPNTNAPILIKVPEGKLVTIRSGDIKIIDGVTWWPIAYEGQEGWASSTFLEKV